MNLQSHIQSQIRHLFTFLAGLVATLAARHLIAPDQADAVTQAGTALMSPLTAFIGVIAVAATRALMTGIGSLLATGAGETKSTNSSSSAPAWAFALLLGVTASGMGLSLMSCSAASWDTAKSIPVKLGIVSDYGTASYSTNTGADVEVNANAIEHAVESNSGK